MSQFSSAIRSLLERLSPDLSHLATLGELVAGVIESGFASVSLNKIAASSISLHNSPDRTDAPTAQTLPDLPVLLEMLHSASDLVATQPGTSSRDALLAQNRPFVLCQNRLYTRRSFQIETELLNHLASHKRAISIFHCTAEMEDAFTAFVTALSNSSSTALPVTLIAASYASLATLTRNLSSDSSLSQTVLNEALGYSSLIKNYRLEYAKPIRKGTLLIEIAAPLTADALAKLLRIAPIDLPIVFFSSPETFSSPESSHLFQSLSALFPKHSLDSSNPNPERVKLRRAFLDFDLQALHSFAKTPIGSPVHLEIFSESQRPPLRLSSGNHFVLTPYARGDWGSYAISDGLRSRTAFEPLFIVDKAPADSPLHRNDLGILKENVFIRNGISYPIDNNLLLSPANALSFDRLASYPDIHIVIPPTYALPPSISRYKLLRASECAQRHLTIHATNEALETILRPSPCEGVPFDLTELSDR